MAFVKRPEAYGLYDPAFEKENCGVGFVADIKGRKSHKIIDDAMQILCNMDHRGARGSEHNTGDGAGILTALPWKFLEKAAKTEAGIELPARGSYAAGLVFLPRNEEERNTCKNTLKNIIEETGQTLLGWRSVPVNNKNLGPTALASEPHMEILFVGAQEGLSSEELDRRLFVIRKQATHTLRGKDSDSDHMFYICSLSTRVMVYKGMLTPEQLHEYFTDLADPDFESHLAMVHSRFATNTFPSWDRAQPLRFMSHNGEINTLRGNVNKMLSRQGKLDSTLFGRELQKAYPIIEPDMSDSGGFDNVLELLLMGGRTLQESVMMMIPEAWENQRHMSKTKKAFYEYHSCIMEPWDGPASIVFTDGNYIGAVLDRNGLRPSRIYITHDDTVVMASEVGVLKIEPSKVKSKTRLQPGKMFLVDFNEGRIIGDDEIKEKIASARPYGDWLAHQKIQMDDIKATANIPGLNQETLRERVRSFGYTVEHLEMLLKPMVENSQEAIGSMGNDTPLAVLSERPRQIYDYFKELFAQVTNPPIDSIREEVIMSIESFIGPERNLLQATSEHAHRLRLTNPVLSNEQLAALKHMNIRGWKSKTIDITFGINGGESGLLKALDRMSLEAENAITEGYSLVILSDRAVSAERIAIPALLAVGAVHHHLVRREKRTQIGIIVESGEPREVHHFCMLAGYGADGINPYLSFEILWQMQREGLFKKKYSDADIVGHFTKAISKGIRKVMGKMGISTLESYKGSQIFEAVGLNDDVIARCFAGTPSRIKGVSFTALAREIITRHEYGYPRGNTNPYDEYLSFGAYHVRAGGEKHMWDAESIAEIQRACWYNDQKAYDRFAERQNARSRSQATLRGLLKFKKSNPIPLYEVEPASEIVKRFVTGAMSYGSISKEAHETLAVAMNRLGGKSNTGEGGEDPERFKPLPNGDSKRSAIKQVASGRFGVTIEYLTNADEIQIKMAQGAKPGEGGELPGHKVDKTIARTRNSTPGVGLISPPPHHDIYSIEDLAQLIYDLKNANPNARISVKLVSEVGVGTIASGVAKGHADHILISGHDGGTGASPLTGIKYAGLPWELGLAETHQTLVMNNLRSRVVLQTDGQLKTGRDVVIAAILGAEECGFSTGPLITMGCIMMRKCHNNTCPVGIATQDPRLRERFAGKPEYVQAFFNFVAEDVRKIMAELGIRRFVDLIGRVDFLETDTSVMHWKSSGIDLTNMIKPALKPSPDVKEYCCIPQDHALDSVLDRRLIDKCRDAILNGRKISLVENIINTNRSVGTMLSHTIAAKHGSKGLSEGTIKSLFKGSAGQSFGAWLASGVEFTLEGDANDYVGKGLSGGRIIIKPPAESTFNPSDNIIIGNVSFYGAISGEAFIRGLAAERFCVRNSGAVVVVEGVGDHGCEYMTGGRALILGPTGRNFAAGMSGGIAYVYDPDNKLPTNSNMGMITLEDLDNEDFKFVRSLIERHASLTGSDTARRLLDRWDTEKDSFVKAMPEDYKKALMAAKDSKENIYG